MLYEVITKETVTHIQDVTNSVTAAVNNLSDDSSKLLDYVSSDVTKSYDMFEKMAVSYSEDASQVDGMVTEISSTSGRLLQLIDEVLRAINEVSIASQEGAEGTTNIAGKTVGIVSKANEVRSQAENAESVAQKLLTNVEKFIIA